MNARVFLLVLVTAAFMAVWDADRPAETRNPVAVWGVCSGTEFLAAQSEHQTPATTAWQPWMKHVNAKLRQNPTEHSELIPLPKNLQSGEWHAFSHDGAMIQITIQRNGSPSCAPTSKADVHQPEISSGKSCVITGDDGVRWCFIKQPPGIARLATDLK